VYIPFITEQNMCMNIMYNKMEKIYYAITSRDARRTT